MRRGYFHRLHEATPTRLWVNNPSGAEIEAALAAGAVSCTTNPAYCSKLLASDPDYIRGVIDEVLRETDDNEEAARLTYRRAAARVVDAFRPLYDETGGRQGYVTMQDFPLQDEDPDAAFAAAKRNSELGPNFMAKIPVITGGMRAIERCLEANIPVCATEVFSIAQAVRISACYDAAAQKTGNTPAFYVTHITGIFDEYLKKTVAREQIEVAPEVLAQAGCTVARKEYATLKGLGCQGTMMGGGARGLSHFTEMVGGDVHITVNWSMAAALLEADGAVVERMDTETPDSVIAELREKLPDFRKAYDDDGLPVEEFAGYGPVQLFRNAFLKGYYILMAEIVTRRHLYAL